MQEYLVQPLQLNGAYFSVPTHELARVALPILKPKITKSQTQTAKNCVKATKPDGTSLGMEWSESTGFSGWHDSKGHEEL